MNQELRELWPDDDRRDAALERILLRLHGIVWTNGRGATRRPDKEVPVLPPERITDKLFNGH